MATICTACHAEMNRWLDTRPSTHVQTGIRMQSHAAYDDTPAGVRGSSTHAQWAALVRRQRQTIADDCRKGVHTEEGTTTPA